MEEEKNSMPPFWLQDSSSHRHHLRRTNSLFFNSAALLIFLLVATLALIFIIAPTLHSFSSHIFKPHAVNRTWDSLNLVLVLFAILCGFLGRNNNNNTDGETPRSYSYQDQSFTVSETMQDSTKPNPERETLRSWYEYDYSDRTAYSYKPFNRLRSINSDPDLRQELSWLNSEERWRFYDDTHVNGYQDRRQITAFREEEKEDLGIKNVEVGTLEVSKKEVPSAPPMPVVAPPSLPSLPHGKGIRRKGKGTYQAVGQAKNHDIGAKRSQPPQPSTTPPPPPIRSKSATKEFLTSIKGKKKKQRHRSLENFDSILNYPKPRTLPSQLPPQLSPPPSLVFESLFSLETEPDKGIITLKPRMRESFYTSKEIVSTTNDISSTSSDLPDLEEVVESANATSEVNECNTNDFGEPEIPLLYQNPDVDIKANTFIAKFRAGLRMEKMNSIKSNLGPSIYTETKEEAGPSSRYKALYVL
ncbi:hypothetical protein Lalb_Chr22g0351971 [Lupinus albus]|uniref:Hydroxyproline-rich glycoprotein family protein n=1 Tax=Lupinus albus TaxID=3870 RepID=A0A6A4MZK8_LUPAL|nr:hypothetical protein Lalb_Chr22g0351971 [Lupinus albus]